MNQKKVAVGLSGGVDSAVCALLLKKAGFDVVGVHLYCWPPESVIEKEGLSRAEWMKKNGCRADEDRISALKTALELEIPFKVLDFSEEYSKRVVDYFYREYEAGRTPNPDVLCNSEIKFGLFLDWATENGFDYVAMGHYARIVCDKSALPTTPFLENGNVNESSDSLRPVTRQFYPEYRDHAKTALRNLSKKADSLQHPCHVLIPKDRHKDQTYFLWKLTQKELAHVLFPLGEYLKSEVRQMAREADLSVAGKKDSQGICFIGPVNVKEFLARRLKDKPGLVVNKEGEIMGKHYGVWKYTIGERGGWEIDVKAQRKLMKSGGTPILYVVEKDAKENLLIVAEADSAVGRSFEVEEINDLSGKLEGNESVLVRIRHGGELLKARPDWTNGAKVSLEKGVRGIASGQSAVFYSENGEVLGGGVIK